MNIKYLYLVFLIVGIVSIYGCSSSISESTISETELIEQDSIPDQNEEELKQEEIEEKDIPFEPLVNESEANIIELDIEENISEEENQDDEISIFVEETLVDYEEKVISFNDKEYKIKVNRIGSSNGWVFNLYYASLTINSKLFENLVMGEIFQLDDGTYLGMIKILRSEVGDIDMPSFLTIYLGTDDSNFTPTKFDERLCEVDEDCVIMPYKCCLCNKNGPGNVMNKKYAEELLEGCSEECSNPPFGEPGDSKLKHKTCSADTKLECINKKCHFNPKSRGPTVYPWY